MSLVLRRLHSKFNVSFALALPTDAVRLDAEQGKNIISDLLSKLKKADAGWRKSGNGKGNQTEGRKVVRVRLRGTPYAMEQISGASEEDEEDGVQIEWADDDRWKFCGDNLPLAYLWGYLEEIHLTTFATQNVERIGLVDGKVGRARAVNGRARNSRKKRDTVFETSINNL